MSDSDTERTVQVPIPTRIESHSEEPENEYELEESEPIDLLLTEENKEMAIHFIFGECQDKTFPEEQMKEIVELFKEGKDAHTGYIGQQRIFENLLPFENDVVKVSAY